MNVSKEFSYTLTSELYQLCNREKYFTCGTNRQYDRMFFLSTDPKFGPREVAILIYMCSDDDADLDTIENQVEKIWNEVHDAEGLARMEEQQAKAERDAEEGYWLDCMGI